jgi:hypothetical protein
MKQADLYSLNGQVMGRCGPTCIREWDSQFNLDIAAELMGVTERKA